MPNIFEGLKGRHIEISNSKTGPINGVFVKELKIHPDKIDPGKQIFRPGALAEVWRNDLADSPLIVAQATFTYAYAGTVKAFHRHQIQYDIWFPATGKMVVILRDLRPNSLTFLNTMVIEAGWESWKRIVIPPGVGHGYKVVSAEPAILFYLVTETYNPSDELRYDENDHNQRFDWNSIPLEITSAKEADAK